MWRAVVGIILAVDVAAVVLYLNGYSPLFILFTIYMVVILVVATVGSAYLIFNNIRDSMRKRRNLESVRRAAPLAPEERQAFWRVQKYDRRFSKTAVAPVGAEMPLRVGPRNVGESTAGEKNLPIVTPAIGKKRIMDVVSRPH